MPSSLFARRHADVRDDDVRLLGIHRGEQRVEVAARRGTSTSGCGSSSRCARLADE
jgi:hypothetical protein